MSEDKNLEDKNLIENDYQNEIQEGIELKKPTKTFNVNVDKHIKDIPDYAFSTNLKVKKRSRIGVFVKVMMGLIIVGISVMLAVGIIVASQDVLGINKPDAAYIVDIEKSSSVAQIAQTLEDRGVIRSALLFRTYYKLAKIDGNFQFGTYPLNSNMSYHVIIDELQQYSTSKEEIRIVFPEGLTLYDMSQLLEKNKVCNAKEFLKAIDAENFGFEFEKNIWENELRFHQLEGYAFPDTYNFFIAENPISVAKRLLKNYDDRVTALMKEKVASTGLTQEKLIIIASIVQREAGKTDEMKRVASVYLNRLKSPKEYARLQADPTREYANQLKLQMDIINQDIIDAYNTYEGIGLPPGPICNPGLEAITAVLEPEETPYLYFCSNLTTGEFYYAETLEQHNKNVRKAGLRQNAN
ncbi:MAG: endolytic transglycosylase MltG [Oscillospiraceae bacterium]